MPTLRTKFTDRANFVNPGLMLINGGVDLRISPKLKVVTNVSMIRFADASVVRQLLQQEGSAGFEDSSIGLDFGAGAKFRPFVNENLFVVLGFSLLSPGGGFASALGSKQKLHSFVGAFSWRIDCLDSYERISAGLTSIFPALFGVDRGVGGRRGRKRAAGGRQRRAGRDLPTRSRAGAERRLHDVPFNARDPHPVAQSLTCVDCHGGNGTATTKEEAHPRPAFPEAWKTSANPHASFTLLNHERHEWIRFVNPSDLRVAPVVCGRCHESIIRNVQKGSMMNSAQVYSTALYNNASVPFKDAMFAENYTPRGEPQIIRTIPAPTAEETRTKGILPFLLPLPRFEVGQPGNIFRVFERGGGPKSELGNPNREDVPGQPDVTVSNRGFGTQGSVDPVMLGAQKVRLNDPVLAFLGTNDSPGDYRNSGCASCHVVYANDRDPFNSGPYAQYGNQGRTANDDPTIPKDESGHPIRHEFTREDSVQPVHHVPRAQRQRLPQHLPRLHVVGRADRRRASVSEDTAQPDARGVDRDGRFNPEEAASRGLWGDPEFLEKVSELNPTLKKAQFSDYHGHGWMFQKVFKRDRKGNFLDAGDRVIPFDDADLWKKAVHLKDIHLEKGMHCVDCHFTQDVHGTGKIYGDRRAAIEIACKDCHGTGSGRDAGDLGSGVGGARSLGRARDAVRRAAVHQPRRQHHAAQHGRGGEAVDRAPTREPDQRESAARAHDPDRRPHLGRSAVDAARASRVAHHLLHVPHVVDDQLFRLPSGGEGQHEEADAPQRRRRDAGLRVVQPAGAAHRRLHARHRRHGPGPQDRAGPLVERGRAQRAERHARMGRQPGADDFVGRLQRQRVQHPRAAHGARRRNEAVHRLPRVARRRQQRLDGVGADAGHQPGQLHGPLHLRGAGRRRVFGRRRDRAR